MRYRICCNNTKNVLNEYTILDTCDINEYVTDMKLSVSLNTVGSLTFTIYPGHPNYDKIKLLTTNITIFEGSENDILFRGRVIRIVRGLYNQKEFTVEEYNGFLMDTRVRPTDAIDWTASNVISKAILKHNSKLEWNDGDTRNNALRGTFNLGNIATLTGSDVFDEREYPTTWDFLHDRVISQRKGYFILRYVGNDVYFDYKKKLSGVSSQKIEFGKNLLNLKNTQDASSIGTALIPLGNMDEDGYYIAIDDVSISVDNKEGDRINSSYIANSYNYGVIERLKHWSSLNSSGAVYWRGKDDANITYLRDKIEITALDMSGIDESIEPFRLGDTVSIISEPHNYEDYLMVKKISKDFLHPQNNKVEVSGSGDTDNDD